MALKFSFDRGKKEIVRPHLILPVIFIQLGSRQLQTQITSLAFTSFPSFINEYSLIHYRPHTDNGISYFYWLVFIPLLTIFPCTFQAVCLLCGFLVVIPPVFGFNCYRKTVQNDHVFVDDGVVQCKDPDDDKCGTLSFTVDPSINVEIRNCTKSARDCVNDVVCGKVREHVESLGGRLSSCSPICCDTDNCNAPGKW